MAAVRKISANLVDQLEKSITTCTTLTPGSDAYEKAIDRWAENAIRRAAIVVQPETPSDISQVVTFCRTHSVDFAVSGGRHSTGGTSSLEDGVVIDLSKMRSVTVDPDAKTCRVQGGATWADVDTKLGEYGLAAVGGTVNHTGVGGLTLGGGYGYLASWYGLTIDNLLGATMVLADGSIVETSETNEPDLFWAIRGAGQSFGVAADFTFRCYEQKTPVWAGLIGIPANDATMEATVDFLNRLSKVSTGEAACYLNIIAPPFLGRQPTLCAACYYNGPVEKAQEFFAPLLKLPQLMNTTREMPYSEVNGMLNQSVPFGGRKVLRGTSTVPHIRLEFLKELIGRVVGFGEQFPDANSMSTIILEFANPEKWSKIPQTATAFANRGEFNNVVTCAIWKDSKDDDACRAWTRETSAIVEKEFAEQRKAGDVRDDAVGVYMNYDGVGVSKNGKEMYGVNYDRLVELKKRYDPENLFNRSYQFV